MVKTCCKTLRKRWKEIRAIHKKYKVFYWLFAGSVLLLALVWVGILLFVDREDLGYEMNLFTEALGVYVSIGITVLVIDIAYERRDKERLRVRLKREAGSRSSAIAIAAIDGLRAENWLLGDNGLLKCAKLNYANLEKVYLADSNLQNAQLVRANLKDADLTKASLTSTILYWC